VLVTGGSRGIGRAIAEAFAKLGDRVAVHHRDSAALAAQVVAGLPGGGHTVVQADLADAEAVRRAVDAACETLGGLDVLVNNAGIVHGAAFLDIEEADFDRVLRVNLKGAFLVGQAAARRMVAQIGTGKPPGAIINMSSVNAVLAIPNQVPYCVSKGGLSQLTSVMALSLAPYGIRVNAIGPGSIMTDILRSVGSDRDARRRILSRTPLGRIGEPEEIASVAVFLASADSSYITGQTVYVDGGRLPLNYVMPVPDDA